VTFGHKDKDARSNSKLQCFLGSLKPPHPMQFAYIMHQFITSYKGGGINCCHLCVIIPSTGSAVVIIPHIILNKLYRRQNSSINISLLILLLPRYVTGSIKRQLTKKIIPMFTCFHCICNFTTHFVTVVASIGLVLRLKVNLHHSESHVVLAVVHLSAV